MAGRDSRSAVWEAGLSVPCWQTGGRGDPDFGRRPPARPATGPAAPAAGRDPRHRCRVSPAPGCRDSARPRAHSARAARTEAGVAGDDGATRHAFGSILVERNARVAPEHARPSRCSRRESSALTKGFLARQRGLASGCHTPAPVYRADCRHLIVHLMRRTRSGCALPKHRR